MNNKSNSKIIIFAKIIKKDGTIKDLGCIVDEKKEEKMVVKSSG